MLIAAGVTFYLLLALFPALAAFVSLYGFVADPTTIADQVSYLGRPPAQCRSRNYRAATESPRVERRRGAQPRVSGRLGNRAVERQQWRQSPVRCNERGLRGGGETKLRSSQPDVGYVHARRVSSSPVFMLLAVGIVPAMLALLHLERWTEVLIAFARWPLLLASIWLGISLIYRYGPSRHNAKWRWLNWGSILATVVWLSASVGLFILSAEFCQLRRHLWFARGRHRPDDVDLDIGNHPHRRGGNQRRDGASDGHRYDRRTPKADGPARRRGCRYRWKVLRRLSARPQSEKLISIESPPVTEVTGNLSRTAAAGHVQPSVSHVSGIT